jgi:cob(I)alamin adenosyltransferase
MTRIYTKSGDAGETSLFGGGRVRKSDPRVDAYGEVDELNAAIGVARAQVGSSRLEPLLERIQDELFTIGSVLATPKDSKAYAHVPKIQDAWIADMERSIDGFDAELAPLSAFILPGGTPLASALHLARTVCRRAERKVVSVPEPDLQVIVYLNRLSDLLFTMARVANARAGVKDVPWRPPK